MGIFAAIVMGSFLWVGATFLLPIMITGTTTGETVILKVLPIALAAVVVGVMVNIFR